MRGLIEDILREAKRRGASFADIRVTDAEGTSVSVEDGQADRVSSAAVSGAGLRVLIDGAWGFAPTNTVTREELRRCLDDALGMAQAASGHVTEPGVVAEVEPVEATVSAEAEIDPREVPLADRVQRIFEIEQVARERDDRVVNTRASYSDSAGKLIIANSFGTWIEQEAMRCSVRLATTAQSGDVRQFATESEARPGGYEIVNAVDPEQWAGAVADRALSLLDAKLAPAGTFDIIIDPRVCGLLAHEAFGHNAEADAVWAGESILAGREGEQVCSELVSIADDPTLEGLNGSFRYDHEGVPARRHDIVRDGVLVGYLHSLETAARLGVEPNGCARAQSHQDEPIVRMSNTFIDGGDATLEEIIADTKDGLLMRGGYWGYVFTARGQFTCNVENAWQIRDGKVGQHYRNASFAGLTLEMLSRVDALGREVSFDLGGMCGKGGQSMHVDAGGPHLRIRDVVVGGQEDGGRA
ncbi:MAG: TldD/PmbA family protein [candidate division WS1 bacterium]|jgi:TldD protein|nr:TldD/PmbA family protein [candidate division WS1 bacterium]